MERLKEGWLEWNGITFNKHAAAILHGNVKNLNTSSSSFFFLVRSKAMLYFFERAKRYFVLYCNER